jgi:hypothetical protein
VVAQLVEQEIEDFRSVGSIPTRSTMSWCKLCNKEFAAAKQSAKFCSRKCASRWAAQQPRKKTKLAKVPLAEEEQCPFCQLLFCKMGISSHIWRVHGAGIDFKPTPAGTKTAWNKGLTSETCELIAKISENVSATAKWQFAEGVRSPSVMSPEARKTLSERQSSNNSGGRCKWYDVSGVKVQGTWERDLALKMNELGVEWARPKVGEFSYLNNKTKLCRYTPDFFISALDAFLEIKGFWWGDDKNKMKLVVEQNPLAKKILLIEKGLFLRLIKAEHSSVFLALLQET